MQQSQFVILLLSGHAEQSRASSIRIFAFEPIIVSCFKNVEVKKNYKQTQQQQPTKQDNVSFPLKKCVASFYLLSVLVHV